MRDRNAYASLRDGLVGAWIPSVSGSGLLLPDLSGQGNNGTLTNMGPEDWVSGQYGRALDFDGSDDRVTTTFNPSKMLGTGLVSMSCWVKLDDLGASTSQTSTFIGGFNVFSLNKRFYLRSESSGVVRFALGSGTVTTTSVVLSSDTWHHVAATFDGLVANIYVDGVKKAISGSGLTTDYFDYGLPIGDLFGSSGTSYDGTGSENHETDGQLDDIRIYNRALSESEIKLLASRPGIGLRPQRRTMYYAPPTGARRRRILTSMP